MSITQDGEYEVPSRQILGDWDDREDHEKMVEKGERCFQCKCCNACHGDLKIYINKIKWMGRKD